MMKFHIEFHKPKFYRYQVGTREKRFVLNKYPGAWIGIAYRIGDYAYCIKWGRPC